MECGDFRGAIEIFNEGISFNPTASLFNNKATCHNMLAMYPEAYFDYSYLIRLEPEVGNHFSSRGLCLAKLKKLNMALDDFEIAIQLDPCALHYYYRAITYSDCGKFESAITGKI
jgi:tetratricopeptide (TPR) repeat protein